MGSTRLPLRKIVLCRPSDRAPSHADKRHRAIMAGQTCVIPR